VADHRRRRTRGGGLVEDQRRRLGGGPAWQTSRGPEQRPLPAGGWSSRLGGSDFSWRRGRMHPRGRGVASGSSPALPLAGRSASPARSSLRALFLPRVSLRTPISPVRPLFSPPFLLCFPAAQSRTPVWRPPRTIRRESDAKSTTSGHHGHKADDIRNYGELSAVSSRGERLGDKATPKRCLKNIGYLTVVSFNKV
jgi:hypothetical protein